jgi:hypothetical protein
MLARMQTPSLPVIEEERESGRETMRKRERERKGEGKRDSEKEEEREGEIGCERDVEYGYFYF